MKRKQIIAVLLAAMMLLSLAACGAVPQTASAEQPSAAPAAAETSAEKTATPAPAATEAPAAEAPAGEVTVADSPVSSVAATAADIDSQLSLIFSQIDKLKQSGGELPWYYTVTDLDHDGCLEFIAASQHPQDRSTNLKIWAVSKDKTSLTECKVEKDPDESFPDIMTDSADTFHNEKDDTWSYLFYDNVVLSDTEVYTQKSAFTLKDGAISYAPFAIEHTKVENGKRVVTHMDNDGKDITAADYNAAGMNTFTDMKRSNTAFDWFTAEQATSLNRLVDSFMVFMGMKKATMEFPVPRPAAMQVPEATATPAPTTAPVPTPVPTPVPDPTYLYITKNPTNETKYEGGTALFVANANVYDSLTWTFVSPYGGEYTASAFAGMFPTASVSGLWGTTLSVSNVSWDLNGWGAYCTFFYQGQTARTSTAYIYIKYDPQPPTPSTGTSYGTVSDWNYSSVSVYCSDLGNLVISWDVIDVDGDIYSGASATVSWSKSGSKTNVTWCHIDGDKPWVGPVKGSMSGTAHEGGAGYAIDLQNGTQVFVDSWNCKVEGTFYDGCSAVVYYYNYPSNDNVYYAEIYGNMGLIVPDNDNDWDYGYVWADDSQGGWAGSNYWINQGWTGADFGENPDYVYEDQGGWAGSQYYANEHYDGEYAGETDNYVNTFYGWMGTHESYNSDGSTYEAFWCPNCGAEVSLARDACPVCGLEF